MKAILGFFRQRWVVSVLGLLAVALVIWFVGPLIAIGGVEPLTGVLARLLTIFFVALIWVITALLRQLRANRANQDMVEGIVQADAGPAAPDQSEEEIATLRQRFEEGMAVLKKSRGNAGGNSLYALPWYVIIGPPGSGKTTALVNSGLRFPLADRFGKEALRGVGGTRDCDWWFTESAVILDTAGRYTTQDSHAEVDSAAWEGFLELLKKNRKRRPINGVFVAVSLSDLMLLGPGERDAHVSAIKRRVQELYDYFGIRFPIYVLFTKADLIAGFMEFFDDLGREEREQVWGFTLPLIERDTEIDLSSTLDTEFQALVGRLNARLVDRLSRERDVQRRALIYGFPRQVGALKELVAGFVHDVFGPSRFETAPMLRGVYFTSGTQEGTPIDRVMGSLARTFGLDAHAAAAYGGQGRSYFINRVLTGVAFAEAGLAGTNRKLEVRRAWLQGGAYAAAVGILAVALLGWITSYFNNRGYIRDVAAGATELEQQIDGLSPQRADPLHALAALNAAREIPGGYGDRAAGQGAPLLAGLGLYQGRRLGRAAADTYVRLLHHSFMPRLQLRLEEQLRRGGDNPDFLFEALKVYLMLDDQEHFDADAVNAWIRLDWEQTLPREVTAEQRAQLGEHLDALLDNMPQQLPMAPDVELVERSRRTLLAMPLADRVYGRLKRLAPARRLPSFTIADAAGRDAGLVFRRKSGEPLTSGIPGLYTYDGYHDVFLVQSSRITGTVAEESWILGEAGAVADASALEQLQGQSGGRQALEQDVLERYLRDYVREYQDLLADLTLAPISSRGEAVTALRILSDESRSPLLLLLQAVQRQTMLDRVDEGEAEDEEDGGGLSEAVDRLRQTLGSAAQRQLPGQLSWREAQIRSVVGTRFRDLQEMMQADQSGTSPFSGILVLLDRLYRLLDDINNAPNPEAELLRRQQEFNGVVGDLNREALRSPPLVRASLTEVKSTIEDVVEGSVQAHVNRLWRSDGLPFCRQAIASRYPVARNGARGEITLEDFGRFFGPGGIVDTFFREHLADHADTARKPWRWRPGSGMAGASQASLRQFERAKVIRDTFFRSGGSMPGVRFDLTPLSMDSRADQFVLSVSGQQTSYSHGPAVPQTFEWPGQGPPEVRLQMAPPAGSGPSGITEQGRWAWFRILDRSEVVPADRPEHFNVTFTIGERSVSYQLRAASAFNPFRLDELEQFSCPERL